MFREIFCFTSRYVFQSVEKENRKDLRVIKLMKLSQAGMVTVHQAGNVIPEDINLFQSGIYIII